MVKKQGVSSTALKALRTLDIVASSQSDLSIQDVADLLKTDKITAYRMLITLHNAGYLVRNEETKRYRLSYKLVSHCRNLLAENEVTNLIMRTLKELSQKTQETLHYSVLDGHEAVLIHRVKGSQLVNVEFQIGDRSPLHCTSVGKVLLAYQDPGIVERVIDAGLARFASNTIVDPETLRKEIRIIKAEGYGLDDHEFADNMRCIAVPVFENGGIVRAGISISGPDSRLTIDKLHEMKGPLMEASSTLSRQLGGIP